MKIMNLTKLTFVVTLFSLCSILNAGTIYYGASGDLILNPNGSTAPKNNLVEVGGFASGFNFTNNTTLSSLTSSFTVLGSTSIANGSNIAGQFSDSAINTTLAGGSLLYMWIFNAPIASNATAWAIISNSAWLAPSSTDVTASVNIDASDSGTYVPTGAAGSVVAGNWSGLGNNDIKLALVPEPTSLGLLGAGMMVVGTMRRRRK